MFHLHNYIDNSFTLQIQDTLANVVKYTLQQCDGAYVLGRHTGGKQSSVSVNRSLTIAELSGSRQPVSSQSNIADRQSALGRICSSSSISSHSSNSVNSRVRSGPHHGRTVVQMLQNSLVQKALNQERAANNNNPNCSTVDCSQTGTLLMCSHMYTHSHCLLNGSAFRRACY